MGSTSDQITVIGAGNLGIALARLLNQVGHEVILGTRDNKSTQTRLQQLKIDGLPVASQAAAVREADMVLLTVPDGVIEQVCSELTEALLPDCIVAHCSGALDSQELHSAQAAGHPVCSAHPLNTFPSAEAAVNTLQDTRHSTALYYEGDDAALERLIPVMTQAGFIGVRIPRQAKLLYHAACVITCNYLTVLMDLGLQAAEHAGLEREGFWQSIQPLVNSTLENISEHGASGALSGPIARYDNETVRRHLAELARVSPALDEIYAALGRHALNLTAAHTSNAPELDELRSLLDRYSAHKPAPK